jgi:hypothetical protein
MDIDNQLYSQKNSSPLNQWGEEKRIVETTVPAPGSPMGSKGWHDCRNAIFLMSTQCFLIMTRPILFHRVEQWETVLKLLKLYPRNLQKSRVLKNSKYLYSCLNSVKAEF